MSWICLGLKACGLTLERDNHIPRWTEPFSHVNLLQSGIFRPNGARIKKKKTKKLRVLMGPVHSRMGSLWAVFEPYVLVFGPGLDVKLGLGLQ